jgi:uncharacterized membrane protein YhaH (DUF805 family)
MEEREGGSGREGAGDERALLETWLRPFVDEPTLWPVLAVVLLTLATFGAALVILALHDRSRAAMAALALLLVLSGRGLVPAVRRRRLGALEALLVALWALVVLGALAYLRFAPG